MSKLKSLTVRGFRSIEALEDFALGSLTVLIGANGAGKSNFVELFRMLRNLADENFQYYSQSIGPETLFFSGPKRTPIFSLRLEFGQNVYEIDIASQAGGGTLIREERGQYTGGHGLGKIKVLGGASLESCLKRRKDETARSPWGGQRMGVPGHIFQSVSSWTVYHVHDTGPHAPMRGWCSVSNNIQLAHDAANLAPLLMKLQDDESGMGRPPKLPPPILKAKHYSRIRDTVRLAAPFLDDFHFQPQRRGPEEQVSLLWTQKGSQEPFQPTLLSDGTIRFIALITALLQPNPPSTIVIDEPELGLHPLAIALLGETIRAVSARTQVILATQSPLLLDQFKPEEVVVVERENGKSVFRRPDAAMLTDWLTDYSLGQIWLSNLMGGRPALD